MNIKKCLCHGTLLITCVITLVGCVSVTDTDILMGTETCSPPCWMDIQPGMTKSADMIEMLQEHEDRGEGILTQLEGDIVRWRTINEKNVYIYYSDDRVVSKIELDLRPSSIRLDTIVSLFGEPSHLDIGKISDGYFFVTIFIPEKGLAFVGSSNEMEVSETDIGFSIQPDMVIIRSVFFQPSDITTVLENLFGANVVSEKISNIQKWIGYGIYCE